MPIDRRAFVHAWKDWDDVCLKMPRHPNGRYGADQAAAYDSQCRALAAEVGLTTNELRERLIALRRYGLTRSDALARVA
jgi:hypothetical protein